MDKMKCDGCQLEVNSDETGTCMSSHTNLEDYCLDDKKSCPDDFFYCEECLNQFKFCSDCNVYIPIEIQKEITEKY